MLYYFSSRDGKAPCAIFHPSITHRPDYSVFKRTKKDKEAEMTAKANHREELRKHYGKDWKKHLNVPEKSLDTPIHFTT